MTQKTSTTKSNGTAITLQFASIIVISASILGSAALAQNVVAVENPEMKNSLARDPGGHWTPENLAQARPRELPVPSARAADLDPASAEAGSLADRWVAPFSSCGAGRFT